MTSYAADTHTGNRRKLNEDCYEADAELGLWLVADGVGGHDSGEVASELTRATVKLVYSESGDLVNAIEAAHAAVLSAIERKEGGLNMGSTIVATAFDGPDYQIAWVGDSRAYLWDGQNLNLLTRDHSMVETLVAKGAITREEAHKHPKRNVITQSIGVSPESGIKVDTTSGSLNAGERLLLCSDGLNDELRDSAIAEIMAQNITVEEQTKYLIEGALNSGGRDNITVVIIDSTNGTIAEVATNPSQTNHANIDKPQMEPDLDLHTVVMSSVADDTDDQLASHTAVHSNANDNNKKAEPDSRERGALSKFFTAIKNVFK
jgi:protein phosphatase